MQAFFSKSAGVSRRPAGRLSYLLFYLAIAVILGLVFSRAAFERPDGIYTGITNNLGDLPLHLQVINSFVQGHNLPPEDPTYAGVRFAYPFLVDFLAAILVRAGAGVISAMWLQNMLMALAMVGSLHYWTVLLTRNRLAGFIAPLLVLFSGGLGWWLLFPDVGSGDGLFSLLAHLPHDYTIMPGGILRWGNSLTTLLAPQRSILFGWPLAIFIFCQWWIVVSQEQSGPATEGARAAQSKSNGVSGKKQRKGSQKNPGQTNAIGSTALYSAGRRMAIAGFSAGMLPLIHAHTFLVVMAVAACLTVIFRSRWRDWLMFFACSLPVSIPEIFWLAQAGVVNARSYLGWQPGWDHGDHNILWFWLVNTGLFIPLLMLALLVRRGDLALPRRLTMFYAPFVFCFIIPNLVKLAPWVWDNIKVLFAWYIASAPLVALLLARWWSRKSRWRWLAPLALASMLLAGGLDVLRVVSEESEYLEFDASAVAIAKVLSATAAPDAVVLHVPTYNSPVFLTGRRSLLGYPGWMWSRGLDFSQRNAEIEHIYSAGPEAGALLHRNSINYVLVGPQELASFKVNEQFWSQYSLLTQEGPYRLYKTNVESKK